MTAKEAKEILQKADNSIMEEIFRKVADYARKGKHKMYFKCKLPEDDKWRIAKQLNAMGYISRATCDNIFVSW